MLDMKGEFHTPLEWKKLLKVLTLITYSKCRVEELERSQGGGAGQKVLVWERDSLMRLLGWQEEMMMMT